MTNRIEWKVVYRHFAAGNNWEEKLAWCRENLYHGGHYEPNWSAQYPFIVFEDEKEYAWFSLAWE
jgi:hypothetical protein